MITTFEVHNTIKAMNEGLSLDDNIMSINAIANNLHVAPIDLSIHIEMLATLIYLKFADKKKEKVRLTYSGKHTIIPSTINIQ